MALRALPGTVARQHPAHVGNDKTGQSRTTAEFQNGPPPAKQALARARACRTQETQTPTRSRGRPSMPVYRHPPTVQGVKTNLWTIARVVDKRNRASRRKAGGPVRQLGAATSFRSAPSSRGRSRTAP